MLFRKYRRGNNQGDHMRNRKVDKISQMLESTHDNSKPVECQLKLPDSSWNCKFNNIQAKTSSIVGDIQSVSKEKKESLQILQEYI